MIVIGAPLCGLGFSLAFASHDPVAVAAAIIACRVGYSLCDVGHNTMLIRVARSSADAGRVSGLRLLFSAAGVALVALVSGAGLSLADVSARHASFSSAAMAGGALYVVTLITAMWVTRQLPAHATPSTQTPVLRPLRTYWRDPRFRRLLLVVAAQAALVPLFQRALPFYGAAVRADPAWAGSAMLTITIAQSVALPGWIAVSRRHCSRAIAMAAHGIAVLALVGLTAAVGTRLDMLMMAVLGIGLGGMNLAIWAMLTAIVQAGMANGAQQEAMPVALFLAVLKAAAAGGNLLLAAIVAAGPLRLPGLAGDSIAMLPIIVTLVPAAGCLVALSLLATARHASVNG